MKYAFVTKEMTKSSFCQRMQEMMDLVQKEPRKSLSMARALVKEAKKAKDYYALSFGRYVEGYSQFNLGSKQRVLENALLAVAFFDKTQDATMKAKSRNLLGVGYVSNEDYQSALVQFKECYRLIKKEKAKHNIALVENNIAICYYYLGDIKSAIKMLERVYNRMIKKSTQDYYLMFGIVYNLGEFYEETNEFEQARRYIKEAEKLTLNDTDVRPIDYTLCRIKICRIHFEIGNEKEGLERIPYIIDLIKNQEDIISFLSHKDLEWIACHLIEIEELDSADILSDYLWAYGQKTKIPVDLITAYKVQGCYFEHIGEVKKALKYYKMIDQQQNLKMKLLQRSQLKLTKDNESLNMKMEVMKKEMENQEIMMSRDELTGLLNRSALTKLMNKYFEECKNSQKKLGCIFVDIDHFKQFNDTYGHVVGDECLSKVGKICRETEHKNIYFARYGGDELFGLMYGYNDEDLIAIAKDIQHKVHDIVAKSENLPEMALSVSVGILNMQIDDDIDIIDIINISDKALYASKHGGKDCIHIYNRELSLRDQDHRFLRVEA